MKKLLTLAIILVAIIASAFNNPSIKSKQKFAVEEFKSAMLVSQSEYDTLTQAFQAKFSNAYGGVMHKDSVKKLLDSMPSDSDLVYFAFGTDPTYKKYTLMIRGSIVAGVPTSSILCYRNGNSASGFCPTNCDLNTSGENNTTVKISLNTVRTMYEAFRVDHPRMTFGGNIDKAALLAIIQSIDEANKNLYFMYCSDPITKLKSVIFIGGGSGNEKLMYRNGLTADSFCPTDCKD